MAAPIRPLTRLKALMREQGVSVKTVARVIRRSEGYVRRRLAAESYLIDMPGEDLTVLAGFFGVAVEELGG